MRDISAFLKRLDQWLATQQAIIAALLVGSFARGTAHAESDVDLVFITPTPEAYLRDTRWLDHFGRVVRSELEDWGLLQSIRVFYEGGLEVEFGITPPHWAAIHPVDEGTRNVVLDGAQILLDRDGMLAALLKAAQAESDGSHA